MKKKLLIPTTTIACALCCAIGLTACGSGSDKDKGPDPYGITVTSSTAESVEAKTKATGWQLTDTKEEDKTDMYCLDVYIAIQSPQPGEIVMGRSDFKVGSVSAASIFEKGDEGILGGDNTFELYYSGNKAPFAPYSTPVITGDNKTGYTEVSTTKYSALINERLGKSKKYIYRVALLFDSQVNPLNLEYKDVRVEMLDDTYTFPGYHYDVNNSLTICVANDEAYKVTYSKKTQTYTTKVDKEYTETKNIITLDGIQYGINVDTYVDPDSFKIEVGNKTYTAKSFYTGKKENSDVLYLYQNHKDDFSNAADYRDLECNYEEFEFGERSTKLEKLSLYFEELTELPESYKITFFDKVVAEK